ncbi:MULTISPECIES: ArpU family phage packaging/lysis transcriptional regulator [Pontibacillus]|uniref:ArpU family phage packaging/lysis transcriptional regulator n=1 Tax=Pontibacillus chungwhensis TaxID=265426 RepID=A0ABY8UYH6_9BACI|nr:MULTISPECIES: ArpU family phage packaging/lysis transcriptional regulator [Pontibacillus]MCD5324761.1 ArpU family transcriptional regulator [Pontibacillus sp. HN14]WIF98721.1 ArpU family phage packaging/lysis transcriptional regulator [Pontibacillus chungwhensis]
MAKQISFELPKINRPKTKERVEAALEKYRMYKLMEPLDASTKITSSFKEVPSSSGFGSHSKTEEAAVEKIDKEAERDVYMRRIERALKRLNRKESAVITKRYMQEDDVFDYETYNDLGFSERTYYRIKGDAFYKLAFILKVAVYEEVEKQ